MAGQRNGNFPFDPMTGDSQEGASGFGFPEDIEDVDMPGLRSPKSHDIESVMRSIPTDQMSNKEYWDTYYEVVEGLKRPRKENF